MSSINVPLGESEASLWEINRASARLKGFLFATAIYPSLGFPSIYCLACCLLEQKSSDVGTCAGALWAGRALVLGVQHPYVYMCLFNGMVFLDKLHPN